MLESSGTHLVSKVDNIPIKDGITFTNSEIHFDIFESLSGGTLTTSIEGQMNAEPEEDKEILLQSSWSFSQDPMSNIEIAAFSNGIYKDVFELDVLGMTNIHSTATIFNEGHLSSFSLKGLGIFGYNCFQNEELQDSLNEQETREEDEITDLSREEKDEDGSIQILNPSCKSSYVTLDLKEKISSMVYFDYPEDILRTFIDLKTDDYAPSIINGISIPYGMSFEYTKEDSKKSRPLLFSGQMNFLSIPGTGRVSVNLEEEYSLVNIDIPTVKLGGGNLQLISQDELFSLYGIQNNNRGQAESKLDIRMNFNDLKKSNTLKFKLAKDHLGESRILLETNILLFEMVARTITYLNEDFIGFGIQGKPFKGSFEARTSVELITGGNIVTEDNSVMKMELIQDKAFRKLEDKTNKLLQQWVSRIIELVEEIKALKDLYLHKLSTLEATHIPIEECDTYEQCLELPYIICEEYAQKAECIIEQEVCQSMAQECTEESEVCTRTNSNGDCLDKITKCDKWENVCLDEQPSTVCLEFATQNIPDHCLRMELSCSSTTSPDNECVSNSLTTEDEMAGARENIHILEGVLLSLSQLSDSSICLIKRSSSDTFIEDCTQNDQEIKNIRDIKILDLLEIKSIVSNMYLSGVISSDSIIFESEILLYGDWTNKLEDSNLDLVERNDLSIEEERTNEGYNSYAKSEVKVLHTLDFDDVDLSSRILYDKIRSIICNEFGVNQAQSDHIQTEITKFSLIDENSKICPTVEELDTSQVSSGLYSEQSALAQQGIGADEGMIQSYTYIFAGGRKEVSTSEEKIEQYNTLDYEERSEEDPQDVTFAEAILDSSSLDIETNETPGEPSSDSLELDRHDKHNKNHHDKNEPSDEETRAQREELERRQRESYSLSINKDQERLDRERIERERQQSHEQSTSPQPNQNATNTTSSLPNEIAPEEASEDATEIQILDH